MMASESHISPEITRRGVFQLAAGTAFRSALPSVSLAPTTLASSNAVVAQTLVPLSAIYLNNMSAAIKYAMWNIKGKEEIQKTVSKPEYYTYQSYLIHMSSHVESRLRALFTVYVHYDDEQIRSFQKTSKWLDTLDQAKEASQQEGYSDFRPYSSETVVLDKAFTTDQEFTSQTILESIIELLDEILSVDDKQRKGLLPFYECSAYYGKTLLDFLLLRSSIHAPYFYQPEKMDELTTRQKVEQLLDFSHDRLSITFDVLDLGYRFGWFYLADEQRKSDKTLESELYRMYRSGFSVEKYRQRKEAFIHELDSLFARRSIRKRLDMKADAKVSSGLSQSATTAVQALPIQSTILTKGIDAIKRVYSHAGRQAANNFMNVMSEDTKEGHGESGVQKAQDPLALENNPTQSPFDDLAKPEIAMPESIPVPRKPQP